MLQQQLKKPLRIIQQTHDLEIHCQKIDYISIISGKTEYIERGIVSLISICCTLSNGNRLIFPPHSQAGAQRQPAGVYSFICT